MDDLELKDPAEELHRRIVSILRDPSKAGKIDQHLRKNLSYYHALKYVLREDPDLAQRYVASRRLDEKGKQREHSKE